MASRGSRGLGMSKADLEASRLVFVYLAQSKPKRKVAIPVPDSYTWEQFLDQVKARLRLTGIRDIYLASTGTKVRGVGELQDIDELCVVEAPTDEIFGNVQINMAGDAGADVEASGPVRQPVGRAPSIPLERHRSGMANGSGGLAHQRSLDGDDNKYARRAHPLQRTLQRVLPGLFPAASLPVTMNDAAGSLDGSSGGTGRGVRRRRPGRRSRLNAQNALAAMAVLSCFGTMAFYALRVSKTASGGDMAVPGLPGTGGPDAGPAPAAAAAATAGTEAAGSGAGPSAAGGAKAGDATAAAPAGNGAGSSGGGGVGGGGGPNSGGRDATAAATIPTPVPGDAASGGGVASGGGGSGTTDRSAVGRAAAASKPVPAG